MSPKLKTAIVPVHTILPLRKNVLRPKAQNLNEAMFEEDEIFPNWHIGLLPEKARVHRSELVLCCASFILTSANGSVAWQLRGMATAPEQQGRGLGRLLLREAQDYALSLSRIAPLTLWCNARTEAVGFYEKLGWTREGIEFIIPGVGPHYRMTKRLR